MLYFYIMDTYKSKYLKYKTKYFTEKQHNQYNQTGGNLAEYADFDVKETQISSLSRNFLQDLILYSSKGDLTCKRLHEILTYVNPKTKKNEVFLHFFKSKNSELEGCYLIMIKGSNDDILIKLAESSRFPRGFPIIWKPNEFCNLYGFYPKFSNDAMEEDASDDTDFINVKQIEFNFKYSGYLIQVFAFRINGKDYWTLCSKNSTSNTYTINAKKIIESKINEVLVRKMIDNNIHFSGECMSICDQKHGAVVLREDIVITSVARGHWVKIIEPADEYSDPYINQSGFIYSSGANMFVDFFSQTKTFAFCMEHGLSIDTIYKITTKEADKVTLIEADEVTSTESDEVTPTDTGKVTSIETGIDNHASDFLQKLSSNRNIMTLKTFQLFWDDVMSKYSDNVDSKTGNVKHLDILGNVLEGLIIKVSYSDDKPNKTIKYKFPFYTIRTMFLRKFFEKYDTLLVPKEYYKAAENFVNYWVVPDTNKGKEYWNYMTSLIIFNYKQWKAEYDKLTFKKTSQCDETLGLNIFLVDKLEKLPEFKLNPAIDYKDLYDKHKAEVFRLLASEAENRPKLNMVLSLGPIGSGKTTISQILSEIGQKRFTHVDGDILDLDSEEVSILKEERNPYTRWNITRSFLENKVPIVSMGGGVLTGGTDKDKRFEYYSDLVSQFGPVNLVVLPMLPINGNDFIILEGADLRIFIDEFIKKDLSTPTHPHVKAVHDIFMSKERLQTAIDDRERRGVPMNASIDVLYGVTTRNYSISKNIINFLKENNSINRLILYPTIRPENRTQIIQKIEDIKPLINKLSIINLDPSKVRFKQRRILVKYTLYGETKMHHITYDYSKGTNTLEFNPLHTSKQNIKMPGKFYNIPENGMYEKFVTDINSIIIDAENYISTEPSQLQSQLVSKITSLVAKIKPLAELLQGGSTIEKHLNILQKTREYNEMVKDVNSLKNMIQKTKGQSEQIVLPVTTISFIVVDLKKLVSVYGSDLINRAHITVNSGLHEPLLMKDATEYINKIINREATYPYVLSLPVHQKKGSGSRSYLFAQTEGADVKIIPHQDIEVTIRGIFYLQN